VFQDETYGTTANRGPTRGRLVTRRGGGTHTGDNAVIKMSEHQGGKGKNGASLDTFIMENLQTR